MTPDLATLQPVTNHARRRSGSAKWAALLLVVAGLCVTTGGGGQNAWADDAKADAKAPDAKAVDSKGGELQVWTPDQFAYKELHGHGDEEKPALLSYKEVEDDQSKTGTALSLNVNNRLLRKSAFPVLKTPTLKDLPIGLYRVTVRMKMQGLLNALGSRVDVGVSGVEHPVYMNEFKEEDAYQEFSFDYEVREPDVAFADPEEFARRIGQRLTPAEIDSLKSVIAGYKGSPLKAPKDASNALASAVQSANSLGKPADSITVSLSLPQTPGRGEGPPPPVPSLRRLTIDTIRVARVAEPDTIVVRDVVPQYAWRRPGETQIFVVSLHNRTKSDKSATLRLVNRFGLDGEEIVNEKPLQIKAANNASVGASARIAWQIPKDHALFGQEIEAQVVVDGQVVSSASSWFTIHPRNNAIVIPGQGSSTRFARSFASVPTVQTYQEYWAPSPYDGAGLVPDDDRMNEPYIAGNSLKEESLAKQALTVNQNLSHGIATFFYTEVHGTGLKAYQYYFEHPEMCQGFLGATPNCTDEMLEKRAKAELALRIWVAGGRKGPPPDLSPHVGFIGLNGYYQETVDITTNGTLKLLSQVPYSGIRWDSGMPFEVFANNGLGESLHISPSEMAQKQIANLDGYKANVRAKFPTFEIRGNWTSGELAGPQKDPFDFDKAKASINADLPLKTLLSDGGSILEEGWYHSFGGYNDYKNVCRNYFRAAVFESAAIKSVGGYHDHMMYSQADLYSPDMIYTRLLSLLGGTHLSFATYGPIPESDLDLGVFATRFGEFFWDTRFQPIRGMDQKVRIDTQADIWSTEGGWKRDEADGGLLYVLPVINPPVTERWFKNRFYVLPAPIRTPLKTYVKIPEGYTTAKVYLLDNKPQPVVRKLESTIDKGEVGFEIPELILFKVVAVEFGK